MLSKAGPQFPALYLLSNITARVFVRGGAPMVVEYRLGSQGTAAVTLTAVMKKGEKSFTRRLEPTGGEVRQVVFTLPEEFGDKPAVATLSVRVGNTSPNDAAPPDFGLFRLGMGEKAVGSMTIERLSFQPGRVRATQREKAAYGFSSRSDFPKVSVEFRLLGRTLRGEPDSRLANVEQLGGVRRGESVSRQWDGRNQKGEVSRGRHQLAVSGWYEEKKGGDWTTALSDERVIVE
ncbi:MAG TPA: hypothetical protein VG148_07055 [Pyrinomonadaceae bacterium]|nr:hypothetical protein [Pyrinomonadaceae bacterium]